MNKSIEQAFNGLVPTLNGDIPPELLELAITLLAQSRSKASNLKPEEEIARPFACANIACERLKQKLNLPKIQSRPPCPPRVYQRLYKYLENALSNATTPRKRSAPSEGARPSPAKQRTPSKSKWPPSEIPKYRYSEAKAIPTDLPPWTIPLIRHICAQNARPAAIPHVIAGVTSIVESSRRTGLKGEQALQPLMNDDVPALALAVCYLVNNRMFSTGDDETTRAGHVSELVESLAAFDGAADKKPTATTAEVDEFIDRMGEKGWMERDWWKNIPSASQVEIGFEESLNAERNGSPAEGSSGQQPGELAPSDEIKLYGLGTMMQARVDYLNKDRQRQYAEWEAGILQRIALIESAR